LFSGNNLAVLATPMATVTKKRHMHAHLVLLNSFILFCIGNEVINLFCMLKTVTWICG